MSRAAFRGEYPPEWPALSLATKLGARFTCVRCQHPGAVKVGAREWEQVERGESLREIERVGDGWVERLALHVYAQRGYRTEIDAEGTRWIRDGSLACTAHCTHERAPVRKRVLTVHHIDGDKGNCRWWNLAALCQGCHLTIQGKVDPAQLYLHPHSEWFRPYVAGFYAFDVLQLELSRPEVEARVEELLLAGQPWLAR